MSTIDQQFVEYTVKALVGHPEDVVVDRTIDEKGVLLTLTVNPADLGRVIGKRGSTALGAKNDARYNLKIVNNDGFSGAREENDYNGNASVDNSTDETVENGSSYAENTRKELAELDDLDI